MMDASGNNSNSNSHSNSNSNPNANQSGLNISFNPMSSGSIAAINSSGYTAVNSEDTDPDLNYQPSLVPQSYDGGQHMKPYQFSHQNSPNSLAQNRMWNSRSNTTNSPGLTSSPSAINSMISSPRSDNQGIHLPSFMNNSIFDGPGPRQNTQPGTSQHHQFNQLDYSSISSMKLNKETQPNSPQYASYGQAVPSQIMASYQRKKQVPMNPSTSSYTSSMASISSFDNRSLSSETKEAGAISMDRGLKLPTYGGNNSYDPSESETIEMLKSELSFKNQVNDCLKEKLRYLDLEDEIKQSEEENRLGDQIRMPKNFVHLFRDLTRALNEKTQQLKETKSKIEAIVVGTVMTKENAVDYYENYDAQDIAHRITNKLAVLQGENRALLHMVSQSNKQSLLIELGLLKNENRALKEKLEKVGQEK